MSDSDRKLESATYRAKRDAQVEATIADKPQSSASLKALAEHMSAESSDKAGKAFRDRLKETHGIDAGEEGPKWKELFK